MLFCSSVDVAGSVIPAAGASVNAADEGWNRFEMRLTTATMPAANSAEISAISKIWRAESLYIRPLSSLKSKFIVRVDKMLTRQSAVVLRHNSAGLKLTNLRSPGAIRQ